MNRTEMPLRSGRLAAMLCLVALLNLPLESSSKPAPAAGTNPPPRLKVDETPLRREVKAATSFAPVIKKVSPSVVNIYSTMTVREQAHPSGRVRGRHAVRAGL